MEMLLLLLQRTVALTIACLLFALPIVAQISFAYNTLNFASGNSEKTTEFLRRPFGDTPEKLLTQTDGKIIAVGTFHDRTSKQRIIVVRYNPNGQLDLNFGTNGKVMTSISVFSDAARTAALQPDGKIIVAGFSSPSNGRNGILLVRYNSDGTLDNTFGVGGQVTTFFPQDSSVVSVMVLPNGKILVVGSFGSALTFPIVKYNSDGSLDTSFGDGGKLIFSQFFLINVDGAALQPDGKFLILTTVASSVTLFRFLPDGTLDPNFNGTGIVYPSGRPKVIAVQPDGRIVLSGVTTSTPERFFTARHNSDGTLDTTFGNVITPILSNAAADSVSIQSNGQIVVTGRSGSSLNKDTFTVVKYNPNGTLDTSFDGDGIAFLPKISGFESNGTVQADNKVIIGAQIGIYNTGVFAIFRVDQNGSLDNSFDDDGFVSTPFGEYSPRFDFDDDCKSDIGVFRPSNGTWYVNRSTGGLLTQQWGGSDDFLTPLIRGGIASIAVYRPSNGTWYILNNPSNEVTSVKFGATGDLPTPGDFDQDGKDEVSVFRPSSGIWYRLNSLNNQFVAVTFGQAGDVPLAGDFDGDGKFDTAVFRPSNGTFYRLNSFSGQFNALQFGQNGDIPMTGDFDGDAKTDISVFRPSNGVWYRINSDNRQFFAVQFGQSGDIPTPADYDCDGVTDISVFRPSNGFWYRINSLSGSFYAEQFGAVGDRPIYGAFLP